MNARRLASLLGVVALGVSLLVIAWPGVVPIGLDRVVVSVVGVLALVLTLRAAQRRRQAGLDEARTPDPELAATTSPPGETFETAVRQFLDPRERTQRTRVRQGLHSAAVAVLTQYGPDTETEARARVGAGRWTDDPYAAAFLGDEDAPSPPVRARLRDALGRESALQRRIRHTVDEIAAAAGVAPRTDDDPDGTLRQLAIRSRDTGGDATPTRFSTPTNYAFDEETDEVVARRSHSTGHWRGVSVVALVGIGLGILVGQPAVLLAGVVGVGYAAYARSSVLPPGGVTVARSLDDGQPAPGDDVEVTVTVTNESDRLLPDLRLVDGVPAALSVSGGSPRLGTALRPGERTTFSYTVTARRGVHDFGPTLLVVRDLASSVEEERLLRAETTLTCVPPLQSGAVPVPLREQSAQYVGQLDTSTGGEGIEFYATRDYRPGDGINRIDWNRRARTGELTTVEFREERAATVVVVVDARESAYVSPVGDPHAVDRAVDAAGQLFASLSDSGNLVGIAATGSDSCWLAPGAGTDHRVAARDLLATHPALSPEPGERLSGLSRWRRQFRRRLPQGAQVVFLTPLCDEYAGRFARRLDESGVPVTVVSIDPTADRTPGHRLARVARTLRISGLRSAGIPVVDWPWAESVDAALARYGERRDA